MKRLMIVSILCAAMSVIVTGCFTSATAHTKRTTSKDGVVTLESDVRIIGTGDKASQVAAEGLFADGSDSDLGAGVKKANASQESTGIEGTLKGVGSVLGSVERLVATSKGVGGPTAAATPVASESETAAVAVSSEASAATPTTSAPRSITGTNGTATVVILGNRNSCSYCRRLWAGLDAATLSAGLCGATITDADKTDNPAVYAQLRPKQAFDYPLVLVYSPDGSLAGQFVARNYTQAALVAKIKALVPSCSAAGIATQWFDSHPTPATVLLGGVVRGPYAGALRPGCCLTPPLCDITAM